MVLLVESKTPARLASAWHLRELGVDDKKCMLDFFLRLSKEDRYSRFHFNASDKALQSYVQKIDFETCVAVGVFLDGQIQGVAELFIESIHGCMGIEEGEMSIAITSVLRGSGVGRLMMDFLKKKAVALGLARIHLAFIASNIPMRKVAANIGMFETGSFHDRIAQAVL